METKKCKLCGTEYLNTREYFYKKFDYKDGLDTTCKFCRRQQDYERRDRKRTKTRICSQCGIEKPLNKEHFGKSSVCKSCKNENKKKYLEAKLKKKNEQKQIEKEKREREKFEEEVYKRMINEPRTKGLADRKFDYPLKVGKKYKVEKLSLRINQIKVSETVIGELIQVTNDFFVIKNKHGFCESFLKKDYLLGEIEIREV